jgi:hypothetical protein
MVITIKNKMKLVRIIVAPGGVSSLYDNKIPTNTDIVEMIVEIITMLLGLVTNCLADEDGIINNEVIKSAPVI